jgi:cytochrome c oxidase cbb3-type subunit 3
MMHGVGRGAALALASLACLAADGGGGCAREERKFREITPVEASAEVSVAGAALADRAGTQGNAWTLNEGKRLYTWFNCSGCHGGGGGGGSGPALMDASWRYGSDAREIARSIIDGRPNGMPAFGARLSSTQAVQLAVYLRSMSGLAPADAAPGRSDSMSFRNAEMATPGRTPYRGPDAVKGRP